MEGKSDQAARYIKSRIITKVIDFFLSIHTLEQQCVLLKGMLQSPQLKYHIQTICIDPSLSKNVIYEKNVLKTSKYIYKQAYECDDQQKLKYILEPAMV